MLDAESFLLLGIAAGGGGGGGGGNPNYVESIAGTLVNLFDDLDFDEIAAAVEDNNATVQLVVQGSMLVGQLWSGGILFSACLFDSPADENPYRAASVYYNHAASLLYAKSFFGSGFVDVPASTSAQLIIIHHPLP